MKPFGVAAFLLFPMAMCVNDQQDENNESTTCQNDEHWTVLPDCGQQVPQV
jgi:hypothetical protein